MSLRDIYSNRLVDGAKIDALPAAPTPAEAGKILKVNIAGTAIEYGTGGGGGGTRTFTAVVGFADSDYTCDGTADDVQIQAAATALSTGGTIFLQSGDYDINNVSIDFNSSTTVKGCGYATKLYNPTINPLLADYTDKATLKFTSKTNVSVSDLYVVGNQDDSTINDANRSGNGIYFYGTDNAMVSNCWLRDGFNAIYVRNADRTNISDCIIRNHEHSLLVMNSTAVNVNNVSIDLETVGARTGYIQRGLHLRHLQDSHFSNIDIKGPTIGCIFLRCESGSELDIENVTFDNITALMTDNSGKTFYIQTNGLKHIKNVLVSNSTFKNTGTNNNVRIETDVANQIDTIRFVNCVFDGQNDAISFGTETVKNVSFENCKFISSDSTAGFQYIENLSLVGCEFVNVGTGAGAYFTHVDGLYIRGCTFDAASGYDFHIAGSVTNVDIDCISVNDNYGIDAATTGNAKINDLVGIGTAIPTKHLEIKDSADTEYLRLNRGGGYLDFVMEATGYRIDSSDKNLFLDTSNAAASIVIRGNGNEGLRVKPDGRVGVGGLTTPTAILHLPAGTATANTAPLKFNTGTALSTPEDGAVEYHSSHLYFTIGSTRYQLDQQVKFTWSEVTGTSQTMAIENGYIANNGSLVTCTLPSTAAIGSRLRVVGKGAGLFKIAQNASQYIRWAAQTTTVGTGGYVQAADQYGAVELVCTTTDNGWTVVSSIGTFTLI